jgi:hypothetical protein
MKIFHNHHLASDRDLAKGLGILVILEFSNGINLYLNNPLALPYAD